MPAKSEMEIKRKINKQTVKSVFRFVEAYLAAELSPNFLFHSFNHTRAVTKHAESIAKNMNLNEDELNILRVSALFHDIGYVKTYDGHERVSAAMARQFLENEEIEPAQISKVVDAILSTKVPQQPKDLISKILCDADLMNLTYDNYFESAANLWLEWKKTGWLKLSEKEFHANSLRFFENHKFHTDYAIGKFEIKKKRNYKRIQEKIAELS
jgi:uncharacterized protein